MKSLIAKGLFPFLVLIILQVILLVSQKCSNFKVTITVFPLDRTLRQQEAAALGTTIAARQSHPESQDLTYTKAMVNVTAWRLLQFS